MSAFPLPGGHGRVAAGARETAVDFAANLPSTHGANLDAGQDGTGEGATGGVRAGISRRRVIARGGTEVTTAMNDRARFRGPPERTVETVFARLALTLAQPFGGRLIQPGLDLMMATLQRRHPDAFERMAELGEADLLVDPADLPAAFLLHIGQHPTLRVVDRSTAANARVRGAFSALLDLFEGRIDGDALFFSLDLTIEGDTEIVVGMRNSLDGEEFDLAADFGALFGPLAKLPLRRPLIHLAETLTSLHEVLLAPAFRRLEQVERRLGRLEEGKR